MKYYKIQVEFGHLGCGNSLPTWIYVKAKNIIKALDKAKHLPAIKHSRLPLEAIEITKEEYELGIERKDYYNKIDQIFSV